MIYYANENSPYIQHYGVLGMKWGRRKSNGSSNNRKIQKNRIKAKKQYKKHLKKNKRHLGINDKGNISLIYGKTTNKAKIKFAAKMVMAAAGISLAAYISKKPNRVVKGMDFVRGISNKPVDSLESYNVFSKSLGRYLTEEELINKGLL